MSRNANGEGSIYKWFKDGKQSGYKGALTYRDDDGNSKRYVAYGRTRKDVKDKLDKARERLNAGGPVRDAKQTCGRLAGALAGDRSGSIRPQGVHQGAVREPVTQASRAATVRRDPDWTG